MTPNGIKSNQMTVVDMYNLSLETLCLTMKSLREAIFARSFNRSAVWAWPHFRPATMAL